MRYGFPTGYKSRLTIFETVNAINDINRELLNEFNERYSLLELTCPLFVRTDSGINEDALKKDRPVNFDVKVTSDIVEYMVSVNKWTRYALYKYDVPIDEGIITQTSSVKRDIPASNTHSILVDQFSIEIALRKENHNYDTLINHCQQLYEALRNVDIMIAKKYSLVEKLPDEAPVYTSQQLENLYPALSPKERETRISRKHAAFFLVGIGSRLNSGSSHSKRAFDVYDWNLSAELIVNFDLLKSAESIAEIGLKVDAQSLIDQAAISGLSTKHTKLYHNLITKNELPTSLGIQIYKSRLYQWLLEKIHIAEVQHSVWSTKMEEFLEKNNIDTL